MGPEVQLHEAPLSCLVLSESGRYILSASIDKPVVKLSTFKHTLKLFQLDTTFPVLDTVFDTDTTKFATSYNRTVEYIDIEAGRLFKADCLGPVNCLAVQNQLLFAGSDRITVYDLRTHKPCLQLDSPHGEITALNVSSSICVGSAGCFTEYDLRKGQQVVLDLGLIFHAEKRICQIAIRDRPYVMLEQAGSSTQVVALDMDAANNEVVLDCRIDPLDTQELYQTEFVLLPNGEILAGSGRADGSGCLFGTHGYNRGPIQVPLNFTGHTVVNKLAYNVSSDMGVAADQTGRCRSFHACNILKQ